jgi:hypothetical protein
MVHLGTRLWFRVSNWSSTNLSCIADLSMVMLLSDDFQLHLFCGIKSDGKMVKCNDQVTLQSAVATI